MAKRKAIPTETQNQILLQCRRRCCLCFWLDGIDEVVKGQIAHLDQDASNDDFENLAFLCFDHHDEYDGKTNVSKGLQKAEVAKWRDELYKEMEYRFRSVKSRKLELSISRFLFVEPGKTFKLEFKLRNVGQATVKNVTVSIRLPRNVSAESPKEPPQDSSGPFGIRMPIVEMPELFGFGELREEFFEPNGRVASIDPLRPMNPGLLPDHTLTLEGLGFHNEDFPDGSELALDFRIDAEDMDPQMGTMQASVPTNLEWLLERKEEFGYPENITVEQLEERLKKEERA